MNWPIVQLSDVAEQCLGKMLDKQKNKGTPMPYLRNPNVRWFEVDTSDLQMMPFEDHEHDRFGLKEGDIVICEGGEAGRAAIWDGRLPDLKFQKAIHRVRPKSQLHNRYFVHRLMADYHAGRLGDYYTGTTIKHFTGKNLKRYRFPLPPLSEQKRIAEILDRAEALRAKRRAALALLDELTQSIFLDMFGDPVSNPMGWPIRSLADVLSMPLRNGLSPSKSGKVVANVLTLSAITGSAFDPLASKKSTFKATPPANQSVDQSDFLICRGNGNVNLVGRGFFPRSSMSDTTFPDTMIAARIDTQVERPFLELLWNSRAVRIQIEASARTTNGTYKVNQTMLEAVNFVCPPLELQNQFTKRTNTVASQKDLLQSSLGELDQLFASLQHRAFRGEL